MRAPSRWLALLLQARAEGVVHQLLQRFFLSLLRRVQRGRDVVIETKSGPHTSKH